tara:strand:+ start:55 stop:1983 length:1929 start_codon:yes stop_codon:yes gene_type:complete
MAIIYTYPQAASLDNNDLFIVSKMDSEDRETRSITAEALSQFIVPLVQGQFLPLVAGPTNPLTGDLYLDPTSSSSSSGSNSIVLKGVDDNGVELVAAKIFTTDSSINPSGQDLSIQNASDAGTLFTSIFVDAFGFVGIGTTSPSANLHVGNDLRVDTTLVVGSNVTFSDYGSGTKTGTATYNLAVDSNGQVIEVATGGGSGIGGSGTTNTVPMWTNSNTLGNSLLVSTISGNGIGVNVAPGSVGSATFKVSSTGTGATPDIMHLSSDTSDATVMLVHSGGTPFGYLGNNSVQGGTSGDMAIRSNNDLLFSSGGSTQHMNLKSTGDLQLPSYGSGSKTGTEAYNLSVDSSGNVIETSGGGGGGGVGSTIDYTLPGNGYEIRFYIENITPGSPDFGQAFAQPQLIAFQRQSAQSTTQGGMPFNLFYNKYTPALDPGYDGASGCGGNMCLKPMMEESVADINLLNSGSVNPTFSWQIFTQDAAALNSYRMPLKMRVDNGGASPGNGTLRITLIKSSNSSPNPVDDATALPSTVSVYFRDTTLTTSRVGRPPFNLLWAGSDTQFAQTHNGGAAYTNSLDYVFTGNSAGDIVRKYEMFFQDEYNAYNRCSYLKVTDGRVVFQDLPTSDPVSKGVLWDDAGTLKISQG